MITVQREPVADVLPEALPLLDLHFREIAHYQDIPLNPDYEFYRTSPVLRCFTARDEGRLTGYAVFGVSRNKHYMDSVQAMQDILYVNPADRGRTGLRLLRTSQAALKAEGVQVVYHHVKKDHPLLGRLLELEGYELVDLIYAKRLDKE